MGAEQTVNGSNGSAATAASVNGSNGSSATAASDRVAVAALDPVMPDPRASGKLPGGRHGIAPEVVAAVQRQRVLAGTIAAVGEKGYSATVVQDVLDHAGVSRLTFYKFFDNLQIGFLTAYEIAIDRLAQRLTAAALGAGDSGADRIPAALAELLRFVEREPRTARAVIVEVNAAGLEGLKRREQTLRRAAVALEGTLQDAEPAKPSPSLTAATIVGGIDSLLHSRLVEGDTEVTPLLPVLTRFALLPYSGVEMAAAEPRRL